MQRLSKGRIKTFAIVVLTIGLFFTGTKLLDETMEDKRNFEQLLNEFYNQLQLTSNSAANVLSNNSGTNELEKSLTQLEERLETTESILYTGHHYISEEINISIFFDGQNFELDHNGKLTQQQITDLESKKEALDYMIRALESDKLNEGHRNVSIEEFNDIIDKGSRLSDR